MNRLFPLRKSAENLAEKVPDLKTAALRTAFQVLHGSHPLRKAGQGETFWQFREYRPGDAPLSIDWRQSGKSDRIQVREKELHRAQSFYFQIKSGTDMDFRSTESLPTKRKHAALLALTLALLHSREGELVAVAGRQRPGHSEKTLETFEHLLLNEEAEDFSANIPSHAGLYLLSDFLEPPEKIENKLASFGARTHNGWMIQILDPAEINLPWRGRVQFENMRGQDRHLTDNAADIAAAYHERILAHIETVKALGAKNGWRHRLCRTDEDPVRALMDIRAHAHNGGAA